MYAYVYIYIYIHIYVHIYIYIYIIFPRAHNTFLGFVAGQGRSPAGARQLTA